MPLPGAPGVALYLKDESTHPSGSLKHRLARSLFLYGLCNGWIGPETTIVEASSGSTAVSEAYFARMLGLRFIAVMPRSTSAEKIAQIAFYGGESHFVDSPAEMYAESARLAEDLGRPLHGPVHLCRAGDGLARQQQHRRIHLQPDGAGGTSDSGWIVVGAGTGGTSATLGRYIRYRRLPTRLCLADPEASVFHRHLADRQRLHRVRAAIGDRGHRPSALRAVLHPELIDRAYAVPDAASIAAARVLSRRIGRSCGGSTGTNLWAVAQIVGEMVRTGEEGSVVTLLCDSGERYRSTHFDDAWLECRGIDIKAAEDAMERFFETGRDSSTPVDRRVSVHSLRSILVAAVRRTAACALDPSSPMVASMGALH